METQLNLFRFRRIYSFVFSSDVNLAAIWPASQPCLPTADHLGLATLHYTVDILTIANKLEDAGKRKLKRTLKWEM